MVDFSGSPKRPQRLIPGDSGGGAQDPGGLTPQPAPGQGAEGGEASFDFGDLERRHQETARETLQRRSRQSRLVAFVVVMVLATVAGGGIALWLGRVEPLVLRPVDDQSIDELSPLEFTVEVRNAEKIAGPLEYTLVGAPEGARIDPESGKFTWRPTEEQGPDRYEMKVRVVAAAKKEQTVQQQFAVLVREVQQPPVLELIGDSTVEVDGTLAFQVRATDPDVPPKPLRYLLGPGAPDGARIHATSGQFQWTPRDAKPGEVYQITVQARKERTKGPSAEQVFQVRVEGSKAIVKPDPDFPVDQLISQLREEEAEVAVVDDAPPHPPLTGKPRWLSIDGQQVAVFGYETAEAAQRDVRALTSESLDEFVKPEPAPSSAYVFHGDRLVAFYAGSDATLLNRLDSHLGRPVLRNTIAATPSAADSPGQPAMPSDEVAGDEIILELYRKHRLLSKSEYPTLREVFAGRFEKQHQDQIQEAFGPQDGQMQQWLDKRVAIKEEFYLGIAPEHDDVPKALALFRDLKERFPEKFESYANLAVAVAVVWDKERGAIHRSPCRQHKSTVPEGEVGAIENFKYFLDTEDVMQGRARFLPWEFLVHMINHRTPLKERLWALRGYLPKRSMFGKCYKDVPYDGGLLEGLRSRINGQPHTLPNLQRYGGVCTGQADYAARVGKSIGVPAFSVGGQSRHGEGHAWVMWVELGAVTRTGFTFSLESHGRYRGDRYYVGHVNDPHTGQRATDRQLELRLHTVGMDPIAKRQADLVMRAYPMIRERAEMDTADQLKFLGRVIEFSPGNEAAWIALAKMSREGQITKANSKPMMHVLNGLFTIFAKLPDFTWEVFDDLVAFQDIPKQRTQLFGRLAAMYEQAGRPDLSCKARLKYAEYLVADERLKDAIQGLTVAIMLFPEEGNFVPKMLDKLEELCGQVDGSPGHLARFYQQFLPKIPQKRGSRPSPYCMRMYRRGIKRFEEAGLGQLAQAYQAQLATLEAAKGAKK